MRRYGLLVFIVLHLAALRVSAGSQKYALILGNNLGHDPSQELSFAEQDAKKLYKVLTELGGFSADHVELLLGADEEQVWATIEAIEKRLTEHAKETKQKTLLLVYYSGHAAGDILELGSSSLEYEKLHKFLRSSKADVRLAFLDSCQSGKMVKMKGGRYGPAFNIRVSEEITSKGYAVITSSSHNELSQESEEIRGAYFTHYLISALRGAGDDSGDGKVTLTEAYEYAYRRTLARTSATIGGSQHPMYNFQLEGRGEIVLTNTNRAGAVVAANFPRKGRLVLLDAEGESMVAETEIAAAHTAYLAVRPGEYQAYFITSDNRVYSAVATASSEKNAELTMDDFQEKELKVTLAKGGVFPAVKKAWIHRLGGGGMWRMWPLEGAVSSYGASLHYRLESPSSWQPAIRLNWSTREDTGLSTGYHDLGAMLGVGYVSSFNRVALRSEVLVGYEHLYQQEWGGEDMQSSPGFDYSGLLGVELAFDSFIIVLDAVIGGRVFKVINKGIVHRLDVQAVIGMGWKWQS